MKIVSGILFFAMWVAFMGVVYWADLPNGKSYDISGVVTNVAVNQGFLEMSVDKMLVDGKSVETNVARVYCNNSKNFEGKRITVKATHKNAKPTRPIFRATTINIMS